MHVYACCLAASGTVLLPLLAGTAWFSYAIEDVGLVGTLVMVHTHVAHSGLQLDPSAAWFVSTRLYFTQTLCCIVDKIRKNSNSIK